jgi:hypothetical protein
VGLSVPSSTPRIVVMGRFSHRITSKVGVSKELVFHAIEDSFAFFTVEKNVFREVVGVDAPHPCVEAYVVDVLIEVGVPEIHGVIAS